MILIYQKSTHTHTHTYNTNGMQAPEADKYLEQVLRKLME